MYDLTFCGINAVQYYLTWYWIKAPSYLEVISSDEEQLLCSLCNSTRWQFFLQSPGIFRYRKWAFFSTKCKTRY